MIINQVGSGGGIGGQLIVTAPNGSTVELTKDFKRYSKPIVNGEAIFKGLVEGTWNVKISNSAGEVSNSSIFVKTNYTIAMAYFAAYIAVTYPEGSTVTCTHTDGTQLKDESGSGSIIFQVNKKGKWTIECTDDTESDDAEVNITYEGQSVSIDLSYHLYLFREGRGAVGAYTVHLGTDTSGGSISPSGIVWSTNDGIGNTIHVKPKVNITNYSKLCVEYKGDTRNGNSTNYGFTMGVGVNAPEGANSIHDWVKSTEKVWDTTRTILTLDVSSVNAEYFVKFAAYATTGTIYNIWLEE